MSISKAVVLKTAGMAALSGVRSMSGAALLTMDGDTTQRTELAPQLFSSDATQAAVRAMALGEILFDKLPFMPNRTSLLPLLGRAATGAFIGANICSAEKESVIKGALIGATSAVAAAAISFQVRKILTKKLHIPDFIVAFAEDTFVMNRGLALLEQHSLPQIQAEAA